MSGLYLVGSAAPGAFRPGRSDTEVHLATLWAAIRAHASQVSPYDDLPPELQHAFLATDRLRRVVPPWTGGPPEDSLL